MKYKANLERILAAALRNSPGIGSNVVISDNGTCVRLTNSGKVTCHKLTAFGKEFLRRGPAADDSQSASEKEGWEVSFARRAVEQAECPCSLC